MRTLGIFLVLTGAVSFLLLRLLNVEFIPVGWADDWGATIGNGIRVGLVVVGAVLWFVGKQKASRVATPSKT